MGPNGPSIELSIGQRAKTHLARTYVPPRTSSSYPRVPTIYNASTLSPVRRSGVIRRELVQLGK